MSNRLFSLVLILAITSSAEAVPLPIYVLGGQSNMSGWGQSDQLTGDLALPQTDVLFHQQGAGFGYLRPFDDDFGPEITFGATLASAYGGPLAIVKHAVGSTSLAEDWDPETGDLYATLLSRTLSAKSYWASHGYEPYVAGFAWVQGEEDAKFADMAAAYAGNFDALVDAMRSDYDAPEAIFSYGLIRGGTFTWREVVRSAQVDEAFDCRRYLVNTDDLSTVEGLHFDTAAHLSLGARLAEPFLPHLAGDVDWDDDVDLDDLNLVRSHFGSSGPGDLDGDCVVDLDDLNLVRGNFGSSSSVPEPTTILLALLTIPGLRSLSSWRRSQLRP